MKKRLRTVFFVTGLSFMLAASPTGNLMQLSGQSTVTAKTYVYRAVKSGKKYHSSRKCKTLLRSKSVERLTLQQARKKGLTKCRVCY